MFSHEIFREIHHQSLMWLFVSKKPSYQQRFNFLLMLILMWKSADDDPKISTLSKSFNHRDQ